MQKIEVPRSDRIQGVTTVNNTLHLATMEKLFYLDVGGLWREVGTDLTLAELLCEWDGELMWKDRRDEREDYRKSIADLGLKG
jgi:hypothetical protein